LKADAALFGILVQLFETPFINGHIEKYIESIKPAKQEASSGSSSSNRRHQHPLYKYYEQMVEKMGEQKWQALKEEPVLNYDYVPKPLTKKYEENGNFFG
jgi:hypothetical protein